MVKTRRLERGAVMTMMMMVKIVLGGKFWN
jgi:hypothetical protein